MGVLSARGGRSQAGPASSAHLVAECSVVHEHIETRIDERAQLGRIPLHVAAPHRLVEDATVQVLPLHVVGVAVGKVSSTRCWSWAAEGKEKIMDATMAAMMAALSQGLSNSRR